MPPRIAGLAAAWQLARYMRAPPARFSLRRSSLLRSLLVSGGGVWLLGALACTTPTTSAETLATSARSEASAEVVRAPEPRDDLPESERDPREEALAELTDILLSQKHLLGVGLDDARSKKAFEAFVDRIDGAKLLLLKSQVDTLGLYAERMDDQLERRDLVLGRKAAKLVAERRKLVAAEVATLLASPFDFSVAEEIETDAKKLAHCATDAELVDRWRKLLKLQVLERLEQMDNLLAESKKPSKEPLDPAAKKMLEAIPASFEAREAKARQELATRYESRFVRLAKLEPLDAVEIFLNAVAASYDPHTAYLAPADKENFDIAMTGTLQGIGAALSEKDQYVVVQELVPGGASWQQGKLEAGDLILAVAQNGKDAVDVMGMPLDKVVQMIRGPKGTVVTLTVKKPEGKIETISITRDIIVIEAAYARGAVLGEKGKKERYGYVFLPSFYGDVGGGPRKPGDRNATDDVRALLAIFQAEKIPGVVIDLRGNGGGLLSHARDISGLFIESGPIVQSRDSAGRVEVLSDTDPAEVYTGEVIVLVDRFSASASEILAAALQDHRRALVVGTGPTHGKGTVQAVIDLDRVAESAPGNPLGVFKLTTQQYFRIDGASTQARGVVPDVLLPDPVAHVESGERTLPNALPWSSVDQLRYRARKPAWSAAELAKASAARVEAEPAFGRIKGYSELVKKRRDDTTEPLAMQAFHAERERDKKALEAADPELKKIDARLEVRVVSDPALPAPKASDAKLRDKLEGWRDEVARDLWVAESLRILGDMTAKR